MRILHLISSKGLFGAERVVIELSNGLKKIGNCQPIVGVIKNKHNPHVEIADEAKACNIETVIFPCSGQFDSKLISLIRGFIKNNRIDLIHCHGYKSNIYGLFASKKKIPTVTTNHNWLTSHWKLKIYCLLDSLWIRYFDQIIAVSDVIKKDMLKYKIPEKKIKVIDNGIDLDRFGKNILPETIRIRKEFGLNNGIKVIGTVGNLGHEKGHEYLLKAAKEIIEIDKAIKFLIVGDGLLRKQIENMVINLGIQNNVIFTGYRKDVPELLSVMDIFVLPSIKEGLPMVLLEAMAARKPVIATRVGAIPKVIKNGDNGILIEPANVVKLKQAVVKLLLNKEMLQELAANGYMTVEKGYSSEAMCRNYLNLYEELISKASWS